MTCARIKTLAYSVMRDSQVREFEAELECDLAIAMDQLGRFRVNVFRQRGERFHCRHFHFFVNGHRACVEGPTKNERKPKHVIHLVWIIRTARSPGRSST